MADPDRGPKQNPNVDPLIDLVKELGAEDRRAFFRALRAAFPEQFARRLLIDTDQLASPFSEPLVPPLDLGTFGSRGKSSDGAKLASDRPSVVFDLLGPRRR